MFGFNQLSRMDIILERRNGKTIRPEHAKDNFAKLTDGFYMVTLRKWSKRTLEQNKYYRQVLTIVGNDIGYDPQELHNIFKNIFLKTTHVSDTFGEIQVIGSTTELTVAWFIEYVEKVQRWCNENWYVIPMQ